MSDKGSQDGSQEEEVKSRLSEEPEMCAQDYEFFEWEEICECPRPVTMDECACQAYKAHLAREQPAQLASAKSGGSI
jgi:hypothetical protein